MGSVKFRFLPRGSHANLPREHSMGLGCLHSAQITSHARPFQGRGLAGKLAPAAPPRDTDRACRFLTLDLTGVGASCHRAERASP